MSRCFQYCVLVALFAFSNAEDANSDRLVETTEHSFGSGAGPVEDWNDFDPAPTSISVGFVLFVILVGCLCFYCCRRRKVPVTFERFSNETDTPQNQRQPPRNKRRFFRRGWNGNQTVNVVVHPMFPTAEAPQRIQVSAGGASAPAQPMVPPPYDQLHQLNHNPPPGHIYRLPQVDADHVSPISRMYR